MKKTIYSILAVAAGVILASGCSKENQQAEKNVTGKFTLCATLPGNLTKTTIDGTDNTKVNWVKDDSLNVWDEKNEYTVYELQSGEGTTSGIFEDCDEMIDTPQYAMYPCFESQATISDGVITTNVLTIQKVPAGSFDPKAAIMVGTVSGENITFHHAVAYLKITAPGDVTNLAEITIESNGGVQLTGDAKFTASTGAFTATGTAKNYVTVKPAGGTFTAGGIYYAAVIPGTYTGGLTVRYLYKDNAAHTLTEKTKSNTTALTIAAGTAKLLGAATTFDHTYEAVQLWAGGPYWAKTNIGAVSPTDNGQYFAWGYTEGCVRNSGNNGWVLASDGTTVKRFSTAYFPNRETAAYQDAAAANWGAGWNVPTKTDFSNLISDTKTTIEYVIDSDSEHWEAYGVKGLLVTGKTSGYTGISIFLAIAGSGTDNLFSDSAAAYWSNIECSESPDGGYVFEFDETVDSYILQSLAKAAGCSVRPVRH